MTEHLDLATLSAYLDNELTTDERADATEHLLACAHCRATLNELDALGRGLRALPCPPLPAELQARLQTRFAPVSRRAWQRGWAQAASAAASILLGLLLGSALPDASPTTAPTHNMLAVLGNAPPGALCTRPEFCYLRVNIK
ncbi:MAG TPA: zf-HC2 domain-containing protein [Pseudomonas sp.]|nr:zf-HC2 domain-containing protein [Pseudomonas sp.]